MGIQAILVPIDGSKESFAALGRVFIIAERFGAHIKALHIMTRASDVSSAGFYNLPVNLRKSAEDNADIGATERAAELQQQFEALCADRNVPISNQPTSKGGATAAWHQEFGDVDELLIRHGRASDVIVVTKPRVREGTVRRSPLGESIEAILLKTGRPVLITPPECVAKRYERGAIGWNDSIECTRALAMTMPWLVEMKEITLLVSQERMASANVLCEYLAWHDVKTKIALLDGRGKQAGESMLRACSKVGAEFLVVGGFSRSRASQLLFGGATDYLLKHANIVTVMVH
jgi:nucleotide-binding universal stress UspA family protein